MTHDRLIVGLTLEQIDSLNHLIGMMTAHGDMIAVVGSSPLEARSLHTIGDAILRAGLAAREILDQVSEQRLGPGATAAPAAASEPAPPTSTSEDA